MSEENQVAESAPAAEAPQFEAEAKAQGWVPKDDFRGSESDWVDAETFVKRGKEIMPILRKNNEKLLKELEATKKSANEAIAVAKEFRDFQKQQFEKKTKELESQLKELQVAKRDAINNSDGDRVVAIESAIDDVKEQRQVADKELQEAEAKAKIAAQPQQALDPLLSTWIEKNDWFGTDQKLTAMANGLGEAIRKENPTLIGKAFLDKLDEELSEYLPEKTGKKKTPNPMDGAVTNSSRPAAKGKKSYDNLPANAQAACDRFVKQGLMTKEQYLQDYDWN